MIVSTLLNLPALIPNDWEKWSTLWEQCAAPIERKTPSHNAGCSTFLGFEIYNNGRTTPLYTAKPFNLAKHFPEMFHALMSIPFKMNFVRFMSSTEDIPPHTDKASTGWEIRNMFSCDDPDPQWYYESMDGTKREWLRLPEETKWFAYYDGYVKHTTVYRPQYPKTIVLINAPQDQVNLYVESQFGFKPEYNINF